MNKRIRKKKIKKLLIDNGCGDLLNNPETRLHKQGCTEAYYRFIRNYVNFSKEYMV